MSSWAKDLISFSSSILLVPVVLVSGHQMAAAERWVNTPILPGPLCSELLAVQGDRKKATDGVLCFPPSSQQRPASGIVCCRGQELVWKAFYRPTSFYLSLELFSLSSVDTTVLISSVCLPCSHTQELTYPPCTALAWLGMIYSKVI